MSKLKIRPAQQSDEVEVHLPDGKVLCGPRGAHAVDFLKIVEEDLPAPLTGVIVNDELHELTYPIEMESRLQPVTMADADGARIYRRSLTFLLETAFSNLFPEAALYIDHSVDSGGFYCHVRGRGPFTVSELSSLETEIRRLVEADLPFERHETPVPDAIAYFESRNYPDKVHLLNHRHKPFITLYSLAGH